MGQRIHINDRELEKMNALANGFANERIDKTIDAIEEKIKASDGNFIYSRMQVQKEIGKMLAIAYSKGYADCFENINVKRLIF